MAARGAEAKELVSKVILNIFTNSFINEKEIRIPVMWDGEEIQIKVALTASKTNIEHDGGIVKKPELPANTTDVVPVGPLTDEQKEKILKDLMGIIDVELEPIKIPIPKNDITEEDIPF